tara:strand:+ start:127 stop:375 length:249 start_codon:yes stop_codon:yes gene_type:complete
MKINLKEELNKKYEYLMNLSQNPSKRKTELPYAVEVLDAKLTELEASLDSIKKTASKDDINIIEHRSTSLKAAITCLIIGTL